MLYSFDMKVVTVIVSIIKLYAWCALPYCSQTNSKTDITPFEKVMRMKKYLLFLLCVTGISTDIIADDLPEKQLKTRRNLHLNGDVKYIEVNNYAVKKSFGFVVKKKIFDTGVYRFDDKGNVIYHKNRLVRGYMGTELSWQEINRKKDSTIIFLNSDFTIKEQNTFDSTGKLVNALWYKYDDNGNVIEKNNDDHYGSDDYRYVYDYNIKNQLVKKSNYDRYGNFITFELYRYDSCGRCIVKCNFGSDDVLIDYNTYAYDSNNNLISEKHYNDNWGSYWESLFDYDAFGNCVNETYKSRGTTTYTYSFKYDSHQNWVRMTTCRIMGNGIRSTTRTVRKITYFK